MKQLEEALDGARDSAAELNDSLTFHEEPGKIQPDLGDVADARDFTSPSDATIVPVARVPEAFNKDDHVRAEMVAAVDKFANSDFEAGEKEKVEEKSRDDVSQVDSAKSRREGRNERFGVIG